MELLTEHHLGMKVKYMPKSSVLGLTLDIDGIVETLKKL